MHHVRVRFARRGSLGGRRAVGLSSVGGVNSGHEPSVRPGSQSSFGVVRSCRRPTRTSWHVRTAARPQRRVATVGHGRHRGVVRAPAPILRSSVVDHSGRGARLERRAEVTSIGLGGCRVTIAPLGRSSETPWSRRTVASGPGSFDHSGHQVGSRSTAGAFHGSRFGCGHRWRHHAPLGGLFETSCLSRTLRPARAHAGDRPTANGTDGAP